MPPLSFFRNFKFISPVTTPVIFIMPGICAWAYYLNTPKEVTKRSPVPLEIPVVTVPAVLTDTRAIIHGMGLVIPSLQISLKSRVGGEITTDSDTFLPGGHIQQGQLVVQIDPADYQLAVDKALSTVEKSMADMQLEQGNQAVASEEIRMLSEKKENEVEVSDLLLRKPQLAQALADLIARTEHSTMS